jgi:hypothetical protein
VRDDVALDSLRNAASALVSLDAAPSREDLDRAVERAVNVLWRAIEACEEAGIDRREILARLGTARTIHARSPFIARAQDWPRGYPGDYETIEYLCDAANRAAPGLGHALEALAFRSPITCQHRNKVAFQADAMVCLQAQAGRRSHSVDRMRRMPGHPFDRAPVAGGEGRARSLRPRLRSARRVLNDWAYSSAYMNASDRTNRPRGCCLLPLQSAG